MKRCFIFLLINIIFIFSNNAQDQWITGTAEWIYPSVHAGHEIQYRIGSSQHPAQSWTVDENYFEILGSTSEMLRVKVKKFPYFTDIYTNISANYSMEGPNPLSHYTSNATLRVRIFPILPIITTFDEYDYPFAYQATKILYLPNDLPNGTTITWFAGDNMTLVSGQGTKEAKFLKSWHGNGKVKAKLNYQWKDYEINFSEVDHFSCTQSNPCLWGDHVCTPVIRACKSEVAIGERVCYYIENYPLGAEIYWEEYADFMDPYYFDGAGAGDFYYQYAFFKPLYKGRTTVSAWIVDSRGYMSRISNSEVVIK